MSVIQQIQEKYAKLMAIIIAIALIIFIIMLAFENGGSLLRGSNSDVVGTVNGEEINITPFRQQVSQYETYLKQQYGQAAGSIVQQQALQNAWESEVSMLVLKNEVNKLGLQIGKKELGDVLYGANPPQQLKQDFTDPETGQYDPVKAKQQLDQVMKVGTPEQKDGINAFISQQEFIRLNEKYNSLLDNSINFPKWMIEKQNTENSQLSTISFVRQVYSTIPDSTIKITDQEVEDYVKKHKDDFKQTESRSISYVAFNAQATAPDTAATLKSVLDMKPEFDTTSNVEDIVARNGNIIPFGNSFLGKAELRSTAQQSGIDFRDTILSLPKNGVYGPYLAGGDYVLAKMLDSKYLPDSVKCRHILIGTVDRQGQPILDDSVAHKRADSIALAIRNGSSFDSLEAQFSTGGSEHQNKGVMTFSSGEIQSENFAPEFGKFILTDGKPGDKKVLKTRFGWHYIEIMDTIKPETQYKIAYLAKQIEPSSETDANANNDATQFAGSSRDQKSFDANAEKLKAKGINKLVQGNISPNDYRLQMGDSRALVKAIYAANLGDVLPVERVGDSYVVAMVTEVKKEGTQSVKDARPLAEAMLRNHKKAELIAKKIGNATTLEAAATALGATVEVADSIRMDNTKPSSISSEPKVIGAAFNAANKGKITSVIEGIQGVYVVRLDNIITTSLMGNANVADQRKAKADQMRMMYMQYAQQGRDLNAEALKEAANIKDNRSKFF